MSNAENNQHTLAVAPFRQKSTCSRESSTPQYGKTHSGSARTQTAALSPHPNTRLVSKGKQFSGKHSVCSSD